MVEGSVALSVVCCSSAVVGAIVAVFVVTVASVVSLVDEVSLVVVDAFVVAMALVVAIDVGVEVSVVWIVVVPCSAISSVPSVLVVLIVIPCTVVDRVVDWTGAVTVGDVLLSGDFEVADVVVVSKVVDESSFVVI